MYGLLLEGVIFLIRQEFGDNVLEQVLEKAEMAEMAFSTHKVYKETYLPRLAQAMSDVTGVELGDVYYKFGVQFVHFVGQYGYDGVLKVLGRHLRDFLSGLDNLHEYLRFSYPKIQPPSFFCANESRTGLTLHYRSRRSGYVHYVQGQIVTVAEKFYNTKLKVEILSETELPNKLINTVLRLHFDNSYYKRLSQYQDSSIIESLPVPSEVFFEVFPFNIVFNRGMKVRNVGHGLTEVLGDIIGQKIYETFTITRPLLEFTWDSVINHTNNVFEIMTIHAVGRGEEVRELRGEEIPNGTGSDADSDEEDAEDLKKIAERFLSLKGQMMYMGDWDSIIFLGTPVMTDIKAMFRVGLYINDLSLHDNSREMILAGSQQSAELKLALDQELKKSKKLEQSMKKLDREMKRTDQLLYQMIPKSVADRLRKGEEAMNTCETFDQVTILFSDVRGFTTICSRISPLEVVTLLNSMYTEFDRLSEKHRVYKVETIGDAYMVVSGAPSVTKFHAQYICDMGLDMVNAVSDIRDPSTNEAIRIRVGAHSGTVVAGVVGMKMPRYCLFGDTVNTASRMETNSEANRIHISQTVADNLKGYPYRLSERGHVEVKGKGNMKTYWLEERTECDPSNTLIMAMEEDKARLAPSIVSSQSDLSLFRHDDDNRSLYSPITSETSSLKGGSRVDLKSVSDERRVSVPVNRREKERPKNVVSPTPQMTNTKNDVKNVTNNHEQNLTVKNSKVKNSVVTRKDSMTDKKVPILNLNPSERQISEARTKQNDHFLSPSEQVKKSSHVEERKAVVKPVEPAAPTRPVEPVEPRPVAPPEPSRRVVQSPEPPQEPPVAPVAPTLCSETHTDSKPKGAAAIMRKPITRFCNLL